MISKERTTGVVLAGGQSKRMGQDKGMLMVDGKPMAKRGLETLEPFCRDLLIIANKEEYRTLNVKVVNDLIPGCGPIMGILTALRYSDTDHILVLPCDAPNVEGGILRELLGKANPSVITVAEFQGRLEPLVGIYPKTVFGKLRSAFEKGERKMQDILQEIGVNKVPFRDSPKFERGFRNINTPEEFRREVQEMRKG